jgi:D-arabinitol 4-dehydrogenase
VLWGPLAGDARLVAALQQAHAEVKQFLKENLKERGHG